MGSEPKFLWVMAFAILAMIALMGVEMPDAMHQETLNQEHIAHLDHVAPLNYSDYLKLVKENPCPNSPK